MKLFLIAGHSENKPGATAFNGRSEHFYTTRLQKKISEKIFGVAVIMDDETTSLSRVIEKVNSEASEGDLLLDIHFNNNNPAATGTEVIVSKETSDDNKERATKLVTGLAELTGFRIRRYSFDRAYKYSSETFIGSIAILEKTKIPAILLEVCFLNDTDLPKYENLEDSVALLIANQYSVIGDLDPKDSKRV